MLRPRYARVNLVDVVCLFAYCFSCDKYPYVYFLTSFPFLFMQDKGSGKSERVTVTPDKGRLSQEEIERMVREAEEFADKDKEVCKPKHSLHVKF